MKYGSHPRTDKQQIIVVSCCVHSEHAPAIRNPLCHYPETPSLSTLPSRTWKSAPLAWVQAHRSASSHLKVGHCYTFPVENESVLFSASLVPQVKFGRKQEVRARVSVDVEVFCRVCSRQIRSQYIRVFNTDQAYGATMSDYVNEQDTHKKNRLFV